MNLLTERRHNVRDDVAFAPVKVRNENDIILLRRTFQSVYQEKLREVLKSHSVDQKTRTAYILRLSQLENSLFENIKKHITVVREECNVEKNQSLLLTAATHPSLLLWKCLTKRAFCRWPRSKAASFDRRN